jgi:hypothetical protein
MRYIISAILFLAILFFAYALINSIREPIQFQAEKVKRTRAVQEQLEDVRTSQELYRDITGMFANNFDSLTYVLRNDSIPIQQVFGDPDDPTNTNFVVKTIYKNAYDSIQKLNINLDSIRYVPFAAKGTTFMIDADTMTYQKTLVNVCEVGTRYNLFMGKFADARYSKYDNSYIPSNMIKFGSLSSPNLSGNWE